MGTSPKDIAFDGSAIWVANSGSNSLTILRSTDGSLIETISLSGSPTELQFDGEGVWVAMKEDSDMGVKEVLLSSGERWVVLRY